MTATGSGFNWEPAFRGLIQDPYVQEEFDRLSAQLKASFDEHSIVEAEQGLINGQAIPTRPSDDAGADAQPGIRWMDGPWLFNADGNIKGTAVIRPPFLNAIENDYAPLGIDTCIGIVLIANGDQTITGIKRAANSTRLLYILNAGTSIITFPDSDARSGAVNQFGLGAPGQTLKLPPGRVVWWFYDVWQQVWRLFALPAVDPGDLPGQLASVFPPTYDWGGAKIYDGVNAAGIGEPAPTFAGAGTPVSSIYGNFRSFATAAVIGSSAGVDSGGTSLINLQHHPTFNILLQTGADITNVRIWVLLTNAALADADDLGGASQYLGFRYSTVAVDGGWVGVSRDAGGVQSVTGPVVAIAPSTYYRLQIRYDGTSMYFSVNGGAEGSKTVNAPALGTQLFWTARVFTQVGGVRTLSWARTWWRSGISPA